MAPIVIGSQTNIQDGTIVHVDEGFPCTIGPRVGVGHRVILHGCTVEEDCLIGMGSVLLNGVRIGRGQRRGGRCGDSRGDAGAAGVARDGRTGPDSPGGGPGAAERIAGTWRHYVEQAQAHKSGRYPLYSV